jgi:hypothetical protein
LELTVPIHRNLPRTHRFEAADGLNDAVEEGLARRIASFASTLESDWPELRSIYVDVWLTDVCGSEPKDFRYFKRNAQLLLNYCADCRTLPDHDLPRQRDALVAGVGAALVVALDKYGRKQARDSAFAAFSDLTPAAPTRPTLDAAALSSDPPQSIVEVVFGESSVQFMDEGVLDRLIQGVLAAGIAELEGISTGSGSSEVGFITSQPQQLVSFIASCLDSAGVAGDLYRVEIDEA